MREEVRRKRSKRGKKYIPGTSHFRKRASCSASLAFSFSSFVILAFRVDFTAAGAGVGVGVGMGVVEGAGDISIDDSASRIAVSSHSIPTSIMLTISIKIFI